MARSMRLANPGRRGGSSVLDLREIFLGVLGFGVEGCKAKDVA